ncbi:MULTISPECIES: hypothetical protein [unclassified Streptomyces]|uniref:hypothetical protein n=1 Tax=unclassified Streptomyces TaxID=2593676 RepID=UPI002E2BB3BC|nr:hypothetical protein [Streptomyces sp. NBC_00223]
MADKPALALDPLRSDVAYRIACLRHLRVNRLNASTWQQADTHWFQALDCEGVLAVQEASVLLDSYVDVRDRVLGFSPSLSSAGRTGAQATWSRNRLPSAGRRLALTETFWQAAGFVLWRRFRVRRTENLRP